jgi:hypothetical protein
LHQIKKNEIIVPSIFEQILMVQTPKDYRGFSSQNVMAPVKMAPPLLTKSLDIQHNGWME